MMTDRQEGLLLIAAMLALSFIFQVQMKQFAIEITPLVTRGDQGFQARLGALLQAALTWRALAIGLLAAALFVIWLLTLTRLELSLALPLASVALVVNAVGSGFLLGEAITLVRLAGVLCVAIGIALVLRT